MSAAKEAKDRLRSASWLKDAAPFFDVLDGASGRTKAVGGIVRDTLLGIVRSKTDIDMATEILPDEVMARGKRAGFGVHPTGLPHGTVTLVADGRTIEVTTLRADEKTFGRHAEVRFGSDWTVDASRRDFTMNALYADMDGTLVDPLGGIEDCLAQRVRFIGDADRRIEEDRLRVYRYFRFAASHGRQVFDDDALAACERAAGDLGPLSAERVGAEMTRLLALPRVAITLGKMAAIGVLEPVRVDEAGLAALARYEGLSETPLIEARLALLAGEADTISLLQERWRLPNALAKSAIRLIAATALAAAESWNALAYRFRDQKLTALELSAALTRIDSGQFDQARSRLSKLSPPPFPVTGKDLKALGYVAGPEMGAILMRLEQQWVDSGFTLGHDDLLAKL